MGIKKALRKTGRRSWPGSPQDPFLSKDQLGCLLCDVGSRCLGEGLTEEQLLGFKSITRKQGPFQSGQTIFKMEDTFKSLFVIQSGAVKIEAVSQEGTSLVDDFFFPGDLVGLEAIGDKHYHHDAVVLETTWVCELPFDQLESLCSFVPRLQHKILIHLAQKIRHVNETIVHGRCLSAEKRLLSFLQMLCKRNAGQKNVNTGSVHLPMSKADIASYLGLRPESLSRALSKLQRGGLIRNHARKIDFLDIDALFKRVSE